MKCALVTGGSRGIGKAICLKLAEQDYHIIINFQSNEDAAKQTLQEVTAKGTTGELLKFDVSKREEIESVLLVLGVSSAIKHIRTRVGTKLDIDEDVRPSVAVSTTSIV